MSIHIVQAQGAYMALVMLHSINTLKICGRYQDNVYQCDGDVLIGQLKLTLCPLS